MKGILCLAALGTVTLSSGCSVDTPVNIRAQDDNSTAYGAELSYTFYKKEHQDTGPTRVGVSVSHLRSDVLFTQNIRNGEFVEVAATTFNGPATLYGSADLSLTNYKMNFEGFVVDEAASLIGGVGFSRMQLDMELRTSSQSGSLNSEPTSLFFYYGLRWYPISALYLELKDDFTITNARGDLEDYSFSNFLLSMCYSPLTEVSLCGGYRDWYLYNSAVNGSDVEMDLRGPVGEVRFNF